MDWKIIIMPLLGGLIGYITNEIAIRMLFHPRKAIYIGRWKLPFTPGLIPQQKERLANSVGNVISSQLLNTDTLKQTLLSEEMMLRVRQKIMVWMDSLGEDSRTVGEVLELHIGPEKLDNGKEWLKENGTRIIVEKLEHAKLGEKIMEKAHETLQDMPIPGLFASFIQGSISGIESMLASIIDDFIREKAPELVSEEIENTEEEVLDIKICDFYELHKDKVPMLVEEILKIYRISIEKKLDMVLEAIDIRKIVVEKVNSFDAVQLEQMIFGIMKKELRAIVNLGALLGFLLGCISLFFR